MSVLQTVALTKTYGAKRAVDNLNMNVQRGDIYGFVGKNGAGKSTLMKIAAGLVEPTAGEVRLFDQIKNDISPLDARFSRVGALIEDPGILPTYSAFENLMCKAIALGMPRPDAHCRELLTLMGLEDTGYKPTKKFSLGMKQRLGLALALVGGPDLLLLDEPFNGLDPEATRSMRNALVQLNRERGVTMVISSHVLDQLDRMATRFGVIRNGRMVREFTVSELHAECGSSIRVKTADPARTLVLLEERLAGAVLRAEPDGGILVSSELAARADTHRSETITSSVSGTPSPSTATPTVEDVARVLRDTDQLVLELSVLERDIEEHFVNLMGGKDEEADDARS